MTSSSKTKNHKKRTRKKVSFDNANNVTVSTRYVWVSLTTYDCDSAVFKHSYMPNRKWCHSMNRQTAKLDWTASNINNIC